MYIWKKQHQGNRGSRNEVPLIGGEHREYKWGKEVTYFTLQIDLVSKNYAQTQSLKWY